MLPMIGKPAGTLSRSRPRTAAGHRGRSSGPSGGGPGAHLAAHPDVAVRPDLALPDRHYLLYALDGVPARLVGRAAPGGGDDDGDARLAGVHPPDAVDYGYVSDHPSTLDLGPDLLELPVGHRTVGLVLEVLDGVAAGLVHPRRADKGADRAAVRSLGVLDHGPHVYLLLDDGEHAFASRRRRGATRQPRRRGSRDLPSSRTRR